MRSAIISDVDGSTEYNKVQLSPSNWAWLAKQKADSGPRGETVESLTWKISRLEKINLVLNGMIAVRGASGSSVTFCRWYSRSCIRTRRPLMEAHPPLPLLAQPLPIPPTVPLRSSSRLCKRIKTPLLHSEHCSLSLSLSIRLNAPFSEKAK